MDDIEIKTLMEFTPTKKFCLAIASLSSLALVAALGSTSLSIALPVHYSLSFARQTHQAPPLIGK